MDIGAPINIEYFLIVCLIASKKKDRHCEITM